MTIEFQCPQCGSQIRVADQAAGKQGSCPKCRTSLLVPNVLPAAPETAELANDLLPAEFPGLPSFSEPSSPLRARRKRSTRKSRGWAAPVVCGAVLIGLTVWFYRTSSPPLQGALQAELVGNPDLPQGLIPPGQIDLPPQTVQELLKDLKSLPLQLNSPLIELKLECEPEGIQVMLQPGKSARWFRVDPAQSPALWEFVQPRVPSWEEARQAELSASATELLQKWHQQLQGTGAPLDSRKFLNSVGLAALVGGLGSQLDALVGLDHHPCVAQDQEGGLYYLLPADTQAFEIRGRETAGPAAFPGKFQTRVTTPQPAPLPAPAHKLRAKPKSADSPADRPDAKEMPSRP